MTEPAAAPALRFSIVAPSLGTPARILPFLNALERQTLPRARWELIVVFDGVPPPPTVAARLEALGARSIVLERNSGPPIARNRGAAAARGEFLVSTDDDVVPESDWLERAEAHLAADPAIDVLEGVTRKPGGRPVRMMADESGQYILCNLVVRRALFQRIGGFHEGYFEPARRLFFREDADIGWLLEDAGARVRRAPDVVVVHPEENPRFLDPLRWTRRYVMDGLLAARFPRRFHERIEAHHLGPLVIRRPIVRASIGYVGALLGSAIAALADHRGLSASLLVIAGACLLVVWAKWRLDPRRLPVVMLVPFGLVTALVRGWWRARGVASVEK